MRKPIPPLYVFFFGMLFGVSALYFLADVRWPKAGPTVVGPVVVGPVAVEPVPPPKPPQPLPREPAPEPVLPELAPSTPPNPPATPEAADPERTGIPANIIPPEQVPPQEPLPRDTLLIPVQGISAARLSDTFTQARADGRVHEAIDILSPTGTPVLAVADGRIVKLFNSKPGGLTLYQFDPSETYAYYYAHLDRYAQGIVEGQQVKRGDLIAYVGSTGNANPAAPHLHFAVFELGPKKNWWQGKAINPYPLLGGY